MSADEALGGSPEVTEGRGRADSEVTPERAESAADVAVATTPSAGERKVYLQCMSFNQDCSHFIAGTTAGFRVFRTSPCSEMLRRESLAAFDRGPIVVAAMKFKTPLFPMVAPGSESSRSGIVKLWDDKRGKFIGEFQSRSEAKSVLVRNDIMVIVCETSVQVFSLNPLKAVAILSMATALNPHGVGALTSSATPWVLCFLGEAVGEVRVQVGLAESTTFCAHEKSVAAVVLDETGSLIATASEFGSRVKVFKREGAQLLYRFRLSSPGASKTITSLAFHPFMRVLGVACASDPTVFLFHCHRDAEVAQGSRERSSSGGLRGLLAAVTPEFLSDTAPVATFTIPDVDREGHPGTDARVEGASIRGPLLGFHPGQLTMWVLHYDGMLHEVELCPELEFGWPGGTHRLDTQLIASTMWFAVRQDFQVTKKSLEPLAEDEEFGDQWHVV